MMKVARIERFGGPEAITLADVPVPVPGRGEVLVEVRAAGVNFWDTEIRAGLGPPGAVQLPHVLGTDGAGIVRAVGPGVGSRRVGEHVVCHADVGCGSCDACVTGHENRCPRPRVIGVHEPGTYAQHVVVPAAHALPFSGATFEQAARLGIPFTTAWHLLVERARVGPGDSVLVVGAGGDVGLAAVQVARLCGARVFAATSTTAKKRRAAEAGAEVVLDYVTGDPWADSRRLTGGWGVDFVVDNSGTKTLARSLDCLCPGGTALVAGCVTGSAVPNLDVRALYVRHLSLVGSSNGTRADHRAVLEQVRTGRLFVPDPEALALSEAGRAHELVASGRKDRGVVLQPAE